MNTRDEIFKTYDLRAVREENTNKQKFLENVFLYNYYDYIKNKSCPRILEIGCNKGYVLLALEKYIKNIEYLKGVDLSPKDIEFAKSLRLKADLVCNDIFVELKNDKKYDVIICKDVMEHIEKNRQGEFVKLINESLTENGLAMIQVPNMDWVFSNHERYMDFTHEIGYTRESLNDIFRLSFGKENVEVIPVKYVFNNTIKRKIVNMVRILIIKIIRLILRFLGEGASDVWFEYREILAISKKQKIHS